MISTVTLSSAGQAPTASVLGGPYSINATNPAGDGFLASNYNVMVNAGMLNVTPAPLAITPLAQSKVYGANGLDSSRFIQKDCKTARRLLPSP